MGALYRSRCRGLSMGRFFVRVLGVSDDVLGFLGFRLVDEDGEFKVYEDLSGKDHIVEKTNPFIYVTDFNDAQHLSRHADNPTIVISP